MNYNFDVCDGEERKRNGVQVREIRCEVLFRRTDVLIFIKLRKCTGLF